jgi:hypothetical protein
MRTQIAVAVGAAGLGLVVAACSSGSSTASSGPASSGAEWYVVGAGGSKIDTS